MEFSNGTVDLFFQILLGLMIAVSMFTGVVFARKRHLTGIITLVIALLLAWGVWLIHAETTSNGGSRNAQIGSLNDAA